LVVLFGWRVVNDAVQHLMTVRDASAWDRWLEMPGIVIAAEWQQYAASELRPRYLRHILIARPKIAQLLPLLERYPPLPGTMSAKVAILFEELPRLPASPDHPGAVALLIELARVAGVGAKAWPDPAIYEQVRLAFRDFRDDLRKLRLEQFTLEPSSLLPAIEAGQRFLRVTTEVQRAYQEHKSLHGVVDFDDLLVMARDLLHDRQDVRARLQERYRFLLIDELQDTDPVQMELVELLSGAEMTTGKLFAVGDHKQSIYRFRGADVSLFQKLRSRLAHEGRQGLTFNFRSQPSILQFTNALLEDALTDYEPLRAHQPQVNPGACVEFHWSAAESEGVTQDRLREAEGIARRIAAMVGREKLVVEQTAEGPRLREVRRGDVVLLFRAMSNVHLYEAALRQFGLDYYLVGGRAFFAQQEIYDLLNLLRALENPQDEVSLAGALRSPFCCLSDEALFVLRTSSAACGLAGPAASPQPAPGARRTLWDGLHDDRTLERLPGDQRPRVLRARGFLDRWRVLKDRLPIARLIGEVFADSGYDAAMQLEFLGDRKLANLWKLIDLARTFDRSGLFGLAEFIARLGDLVANQPREEQAATQPENADVVRLMSIHQAKGLEFPIVILPDMDAAVGGPQLPVAHWDCQLGCVVRPPSDDPEPTFDDQGWSLWRMREDIEDWHESLRTLYVACTRAQDYLILSASLPSSLKVSSPWIQTLASRFDLRSGESLAANLSRARVIGSLIGLEIGAEEHWRAGGVNPPVEDQGVYTPRSPDATGWPEPIPLRACGQRVFTVEELEAFLLDPIAACAFGNAGGFVRQQDAEDGSDLHSWPTRRQQCEPRSMQRSVREQVLRAVLQFSDLSDPQIWQAYLRRTASRLRLPLEETVELEEALYRFVQQHDWLRRSGCWFEREFLLEWPDKHSFRVLHQTPVIRGIIDVLWRREKQWGLLWLSADPLTGHGALIEQRPGLVFWAYAGRKWFGSWPRSVEAYSLADGSVLTENVFWERAELIGQFEDALARRLHEEEPA
jgi:ATP-dependent helicase/nuclease subunit A